MIEYIGKTLLIDKKILVIGDLHLGYGSSLRKSGVMVPTSGYNESIDDLNKIFSRIGRVEKIVILGDIKHEIGAILNDERKEVSDLLEFISKFSKETIIIKGNHDIMINFIVRDIRVVDFFIYKDFVFLHGNRNFSELFDKRIKFWVMGHIHPAITLKDGPKEERYKCFLVGNYGGKKIIFVPSFFPLIEGTDVREKKQALPWPFNFGSFNVLVASGLEVLDFGRLSRI